MKMKVHVSEGVFWKIRKDTDVMYITETDEKIDLYMPMDGFFICAEHIKPEDTSAEEYMIWRASHIINYVPILRLEDGTKKYQLVEVIDD